jgi:hypothetical protein
MDAIGLTRAAHRMSKMCRKRSEVVAQALRTEFHLGTFCGSPESGGPGRSDRGQICLAQTRSISGVRSEWEDLRWSGPSWSKIKNCLGTPIRSGVIRTPGNWRWRATMPRVNRPRLCSAGPRFRATGASHSISFLTPPPKEEKGSQQ